VTPIVLLALAFAAIIAIGTGAAWVHDALEARLRAPTRRPARQPIRRPARPGVVRRRVGVRTAG
jgi:hypothetical protein